jgi:predicted membrane-bound spermidine synthase
MTLNLLINIWKVILLKTITSHNHYIILKLAFYLTIVHLHALFNNSNKIRNVNEKFRLTGV